ncbi:hypothetical protein OKA04_04395 [Luteolibacter flavescens]|uniref:Uncharacterized protein n=2 Tax=Luteolibacter flavescens TaxID=1859460 RepID=A0ABT3FK88_9BACT|nr:hypothetical protein [Luteolibacter flavescens]
MWSAAMMMPAVADFVPPAEGPVPFRRDKLPVDVDTMTALSRQISVLAAAEEAEKPDELRSVAQMAALSLALDPANRQARDLIAAAEKGDMPDSPDSKEIERARTRAWQTLSWLEMPEAGADANALAACLGDVLAVADPGHPKSKERVSELGAWKDWVATKEAFRTPKEAFRTPKEAVKPADPEPTDTTPPEPEDGGQKAVLGLALADLEAAMPVWVHDAETGVESLQALKVTFHGEISGKGRTQLMIPGEGLTQRMAKPFQALEKAMEARHGTLPAGLTVSLGFGKSSYSLSRNGTALSGTAALLLEGALTGEMPTAITLAQVGEGGKLELPPKFWKTLRALSEMPGGGRLILPDQAAEFLPALLTMNDAAFFMKREVVLASTVDELCNLAAAAPQGPAGDAMKRFGEIRKVGDGKPLGTFVAHQATQQRLKEVTDLMPKHASARMLALQGSGNRARSLARPVLAREIRRSLEPIAVLMTLKQEEPTAEAQLDKAHAASREVLDSLTSYIDIRDRDLHKAAMDVTDSVRTLSRLLSKSENENNTMAPKKNLAAKAAREAYLKAIRELTAAAGDEVDYPLPRGAGGGN